MLIKLCLLCLGILALGCHSLWGTDLTLDETSGIGIEVRSTFHNFTGKATNATGTLQLATEPIDATAVLEFPVSKITTESIQRDARMEEWLEITRFPTITYHLKSLHVLEGDPEKATRQDPACFEVVGTLTIHGQTQPLKTTVQGWREGKFLVTAGSIDIHTPDFKLPQIKMLFLSVNEDVRVNFELHFNLPEKYQMP